MYAEQRSLASHRMMLMKWNSLPFVWKSNDVLNELVTNHRSELKAGG